MELGFGARCVWSWGLGHGIYGAGVQSTVFMELGFGARYLWSWGSGHRVGILVGLARYRRHCCDHRCGWLVLDLRPIGEGLGDRGLTLL